MALPTGFHGSAATRRGPDRRQSDPPPAGGPFEFFRYVGPSSLRPAAIPSPPSENQLHGTRIHGVCLGEKKKRIPFCPSPTASQPPAAAAVAAAARDRVGPAVQKERKKNDDDDKRGGVRRARSKRRRRRRRLRLVGLAYFVANAAGWAKRGAHTAAAASQESVLASGGAGGGRAGDRGRAGRCGGAAVVRGDLCECNAAHTHTRARARTPQPTHARGARTRTNRTHRTHRQLGTDFVPASATASTARKTYAAHTTLLCCCPAHSHARSRRDRYGVSLVSLFFPFFFFFYNFISFTYRLTFFFF